MATYSWAAPPVSTTEPEVLRYARFLPSGNLFTVGALDKDYNGGCHGKYSGKRISTWNVNTGKRLLLHQYEDDLEEVALSPDGKMLASWHTKEDSDDADATIDFFCTSEISATFGSRRSTIRGGHAAIQQTAFSPDSRKFAFSYHWGPFKDNADTKLRQKDIRVYMISPPQEFCWLTTDEHTATELKFSPNGQYLAALCTSDIHLSNSPTGGIYLWDLHKIKKLGKITHPSLTNQDPHLEFSSDSKSLLLGFESDVLRYRIDSAGNIGPAQPATQADIRPLLNPSGISIPSIPKDTYLVTDSETGAEIINLNRVPPQTSYPALCGNGNQFSLTASPDGRYLVLDNQILDLKLRQLNNLDLMPPPHYTQWTLPTAP